MRTRSWKPCGKRRRSGGAKYWPLFLDCRHLAQETQLPLSRAAELLKLPLAQREAILAEQAARAAADYASDPELTAFDAFGEDDLHVDSSDTQTR